MEQSCFVERLTIHHTNYQSSLNFSYIASVLYKASSTPSAIL
ncbi:hypothetical protein P20439_0398 [Pseudoalteromonas sp. BSi20439]|nr:hypothetical protein P20439_0398 [Pseudoalteromonas sp. BSi20439]